MKKVGVLTTHRANNFGSQLQAFALSRYLDSMPGVDCQIIEYIPPNSDLGSYLPARSMKDVVRNGLVFLRKRRYDIWTSSMQQFVAEHMVTSEKVYTDETLAELSDEFDAVVCGSDQIWNPELRDASLSFFLPQPTGLRKVAYAPSMGSGSFTVDERSVVSAALADFHRLSVRDKRSHEIISHLTDKDISIVVDPSLLLEPAVYLEKSAPPQYDDDYIFLFSVKYDEAAIRAARNASRILGLPVRVMITGRKALYSESLYGFEVAPSSSPSDFLSLIKGARVVLSNSFHGTAFSIIFQKCFYVVQDMEGRTDTRLESLLEACGLSERVLSPHSVSISDDEPNYSAAAIIREQSVSHAKGYLEEALA